MYEILEKTELIEDEWGTLYEWLVLNSDFTARGLLPTCYEEWRAIAQERLAYHQLWYTLEDGLIGWVGIESNGEIHIVIGPAAKGHLMVLPTAEKGLDLIFRRFSAVHGYGHPANGALHKFTAYLGFTHSEQVDCVFYRLTKDAFYGRKRKSRRVLALTNSPTMC